MASSSRSSNLLGKRSIVARIAAVLALAGVALAIYLVVMSFTADEGAGDDPKKDRKARSEQRA